MADGFEVDLPALRAAAEGVRATVEQVAAGGTPPVGALAGHDGLGRALDGFLERWRRGVQALAEDGRAIADQLDADARAYVAVDEAGASVLRGGGVDPAGG